VEIDDIISGCVRGSREAQRELYERFSKNHFRICLNYISDRDVAMDVLHDSFMKIFRGIKPFENGQDFEAWMRTVVINTCIDQIRRAKKMRYLEMEEGEELGADQTTGKLEEKDLLSRISLLPEGAKCVLNLYAIEGYNHKEIASLLNISEGTSKSQLSRARQLLKNLIRFNPHNHD
jgi:RNA polymerase sigma factor (sigma-70 family)